MNFTAMLKISFMFMYLLVFSKVLKPVHCKNYIPCKTVSPTHLHRVFPSKDLAKSTQSFSYKDFLNIFFSKDIIKLSTVL